MKPQVAAALLIGACLALVAGLIVWRMQPAGPGSTAQQPGGGGKPPPGGDAVLAVAATNRLDPAAATSAVARLAVDTFTNRAASADAVAPADQARLDALQKMLDDDDASGILDISRQLMKSERAELRSRAIEGLGWVGLKALPELSELISDPDPDVATEAFDQWKSAVREIADDAAKAQILLSGIPSLKKQADMEACVMEFDAMPEELAVRSLVKLVQSENRVASEVAREHYEFVTGEPYATPEQAEAWIKQNREQ